LGAAGAIGIAAAVDSIALPCPIQRA
jgi:hypothetical protein